MVVLILCGVAITFAVLGLFAVLIWTFASAIF